MLQANGERERDPSSPTYFQKFVWQDQDYNRVTEFSYSYIL